MKEQEPNYKLEWLHGNIAVVTRSYDPGHVPIFEERTGLKSKHEAAEIAPGPAKFRSKVLAKIERRCVRCASEGGLYYRRARDLGLGAVIVCVLTIVLWAGIITGLNMAIRMAGGAH